MNLPEGLEETAMRTKRNIDPRAAASLVQSPRWTIKTQHQSDGCIVWTGATIPTGYGQIVLGGTVVRAHRVAWVARNGSDIPDGLVIDHLCGNRSCVNVDHLQVVTQRENVLRGDTIIAAAAKRTHCPQGHPLTGSNLVASSAHRRCRTCSLADKKRRREASDE